MSPKPMMPIGMACSAACIYPICGGRYIRQSSSWKQCWMLASRVRPGFIEDTDLDGTDELYLQNGLIQAVLKLDGNGSVCELDSYLLKHNFGDTLRRQAEHYYRKIHQNENSGHGGSGIASAHERVSFKHKIDAEDMEIDERCARICSSIA